MSDYAPAPDHLEAVLVETMSHPLRARILTTVCERPGVTIKQLSHHLDETPRKVRHQVDRLIEAGLVAVDGETSRRNARERHYRALVKRIVVADDAPTNEQVGRATASNVLRIMVDDIRAAIGDRSFGTRPGHAEIRIPGEVDQRGWSELGDIYRRAYTEIETTMIESAQRLRDGEETGIEVISALLLFEAPAVVVIDGGPGLPVHGELWTGEDDPAA
jgi:DNA-binding transcriptional ArsR family regulator